MLLWLTIWMSLIPKGNYFKSCKWKRASIMPALWGQTLGFFRGIGLNFRDGFFIILHNICEVQGAIPPNRVPRTGRFWQISEKIAYFRVIFRKWDELTYIFIKDALFSISWEVIMIFLLGHWVSGGTVNMPLLWYC